MVDVGMKMMTPSGAEFSVYGASPSDIDDLPTSDLLHLMQSCVGQLDVDLNRIGLLAMVRYLVRQHDKVGEVPIAGGMLNAKNKKEQTG